LWNTPTEREAADHTDPSSKKSHQPPWRFLRVPIRHPRRSALRASQRPIRQQRHRLPRRLLAVGLRKTAEKTLNASAPRHHRLRRLGHAHSADRSEHEAQAAGDEQTPDQPRPVLAQDVGEGQGEHEPEANHQGVGEPVQGRLRLARRSPPARRKLSLGCVLLGCRHRRQSCIRHHLNRALAVRMAAWLRSGGHWPALTAFPATRAPRQASAPTGEIGASIDETESGRQASRLRDRRWSGRARPESDVLARADRIVSADRPRGRSGSLDAPTQPSGMPRQGRLVRHLLRLIPRARVYKEDTEGVLGGRARTRPTSLTLSTPACRLVCRRPARPAVEREAGKLILVRTMGPR
jgi:hypothetical protein